MFIGRKNEFSVLEDTYKMPGFQMTVIYGRRRIGKSRLITEFIKGKKASYRYRSMCRRSKQSNRDCRQGAHYDCDSVICFEESGHSWHYLQDHARDRER